MDSAEALGDFLLEPEAPGDHLVAYCVDQQMQGGIPAVAKQLCTLWYRLQKLFEIPVELLTIAFLQREVFLQRVTGLRQRDRCLDRSLTTAQHLAGVILDPLQMVLENARLPGVRCEAVQRVLQPV